MKLTIITINYNNAAGLQRTMESVLKQTNTNFEYIVVDGGSLDGSKEIIKKFENRFENNLNRNHPLRWISESDNGIYHAMNKGIRAATGEYVHFLNSGDYLTSNRVVDSMLNELNNCDILIGTKISARIDGKIRKEIKFKEPLTMYTFYRGTIEHTSAYIRRSLFERYGLYDESLKIVSDWKWYMLSIIWGDAVVKFTDIPVSYFDTTGISSTNLGLDKKERRMVLEELLPTKLLQDYDLYSFDIDQMQRIKRYTILYTIFYIIERLLFKVDKIAFKYSYKKTNKQTSFLTTQNHD